MHPELARRMERAPLHKFAGLEKHSTELISSGRDVIRLDIGSPDQPPAPHILDALTQSANTPGHHGYPGYFGTPALRQAVVDYYARRFNVTLDVKTEVLPLIGSKEGIYNLAFAYLDAGDVALCPNLGYPTYMAGALLAGAEVYALEMRPEHDWTPDLDSIPADVLQRAKILWLNYPNNPTGATASIEFFAHAIDFARRHNLLLAHDNPYCEITFDGYVAPSLLQVPGAGEVAIEFNSFSKTYNMGGWRLGMVVGNAQSIGSLSRLKTNVDSGIFRAIQDAGVAALTGDQEWLSERNELYAVRRDIVVNGLRQAGFTVDRPRATIYVWARIPATGLTSEQFCARLLDEALVSIAPGSIFGVQGEQYVRISLGQATRRIEEAIQRVIHWNTLA